jgi:hypothetical protein
LLTFEEFSVKKKIDLAVFQQAEPALYSEFKSEYDQMGEKSFDHSKKFLFNKLRRTYHLKEEPKPAKTSIEINEIASQAEALYSPTIEQKPAHIPTEEKPTGKPGYKPRFNIKNIKPASEQ